MSKASTGKPVRDEDATPPSGWNVGEIGARLTAAALFEEHWQFVFQLLPSYGVLGSSQDDVAQTVWEDIHAKIDTYDPERQSARAWICGFVRRCAVSCRRSLRRRPETLEENPGANIETSGLNPEQYAMLRMLERALPDEEQREAFILYERHGLAYEEIAAAMELSEGHVERKLREARELLLTWDP